MTNWLRIVAIENSFLVESDEYAKIWLSLIDGAAKPRSFGVSGHELVNHTPIIQALKVFLSATSTEELIGQEFQAEIADTGDELNIVTLI
ncbi:MAG: hypothetical protein ACI4UF_03850 [Thermoguttaceae bacterium]